MFNFRGVNHGFCLAKSFLSQLQELVNQQSTQPHQTGLANMLFFPELWTTSSKLSATKGSG